MPGDARQVRLVFGGLALTILLASLDQTILSTALPTIVGELGGVGGMAWVVTGYIVAATVVMPVYGRLGDGIGRKPLFLAAVAIFVVGSAAGGFAGSVTWLVVARVVQGLGGGGIVVTAQAIVADVIPARQRGRYMGVLGAVFAVSSVAGPLLGGFFTDVAGWRWCFFVNVPLGAAALLVAARLLPGAAAARRRPRWDRAGMACSAVGVTAIVLLSGWAGTRYPWTSPTIIGLAVVIVVAVGLFVLAERRAAEPIIPLGLFAERTFVLATAAGLLVGVGLFATASYLPTFLQMAAGNGASSAGLRMVPMMAGLLLASIVSGQQISATGRYRAYPIAGMIVAGTATALMSTMTATTPGIVVSAYLLMFGIGIGLVMQVLVLVVQNAADHAVIGTVTAANNYLREIGASLGTAVVGSVFTARLAVALAERPAVPAAVRDAGVTPSAVAALPEPVRAAVADAYAGALTPILGAMTLVFAGGLILVAFLPHLPLRTTLAEPTGVH